MAATTCIGQQLRIRGSRMRAKRPKAMKLETCPRLRGVVEDKLELWWSPAQISLWLETEYGDNQEVLCARSCGVLCAPGGRDAAPRDVRGPRRVRFVTW
jgi:hypothetical protein